PNGIQTRNQKYLPADKSPPRPVGCARAIGQSGLPVPCFGHGSACPGGSRMQSIFSFLRPINVISPNIINPSKYEYKQTGYVCKCLLCPVGGPALFVPYKPKQ